MSRVHMPFLLAAATLIAAGCQHAQDGPASSSPPANVAELPVGTAAIVDGEVISNIELRDRMRLIIETSDDFIMSEEALRRVQEQALGQLIHERQRLQQGEALDTEVD